MNYYLISFEVELPPKRWRNFAKFEKFTRLIRAHDPDDAMLRLDIYLQKTYPEHLSTRNYENLTIE